MDHDCAINALRRCNGLSYTAVAGMLLRAGYTPSKGILFGNFCMVLHQHGFTLYYDCSRWLHHPMTISDFCQRDKQGKFVLIIDGHALAVVDGKTYDNEPTNPDAAIIAAFKYPF